MELDSDIKQGFRRFLEIEFALFVNATEKGHIPHKVSRTVVN